MGWVVVSCDQSGKLWIIWSKSYNIAGTEMISKKSLAAIFLIKTFHFPIFFEILLFLYFYKFNFFIDTL